MFSFIKKLFFGNKINVENVFVSLQLSYKNDMESVVTIHVNKKNHGYEIRYWEQSNKTRGCKPYFWNGKEWQPATSIESLDFATDLNRSCCVKDANKVKKIVKKVIPWFRI